MMRDKDPTEMGRVESPDGSRPIGQSEHTAPDPRPILGRAASLPTIKTQPRDSSRLGWGILPTSAATQHSSVQQLPSLLIHPSH